MKEFERGNSVGRAAQFTLLLILIIVMTMSNKNHRIMKYFSSPLSSCKVSVSTVAEEKIVINNKIWSVKIQFL